MRQTGQLIRSMGASVLRASQEYALEENLTEPLLKRVRKLMTKRRLVRGG
jgi:hypothetical protein